MFVLFHLYYHYTIYQDFVHRPVRIVLGVTGKLSIEKSNTGVGLFYQTGIYIGGYYTDDMTDVSVVIVNSRNGTYYPASVLIESSSDYNWNSMGTFVPRNPQEGKTYRFFKAKLV